MSKMGRPSLFPVGQESAIKKLILLGATDNDLAEAYDVHPDTVQNWKKQRPDFFESLKDWKAQADQEVEKALFQRAKGYVTKETKVLANSADPQNPVLVTIEKHYPPDTAAAVVWLGNRKPDTWKKDPSGSDASESIADSLAKLADSLPE